MINGLRVKYRLFLWDLMELEFSRQILEKMFKYDILWKSVQWEPSCSARPDEQTDIHEANSHTSQNCEKRLKTKTISIVI